MGRMKLDMEEIKAKLAENNSLLKCIWQKLKSQRNHSSNNNNKEDARPLSASFDEFGKLRVQYVESSRAATGGAEVPTGPCRTTWYGNSHNILKPQ